MIYKKHIKELSVKELRNNKLRKDLVNMINMKKVEAMIMAEKIKNLLSKPTFESEASTKALRPVPVFDLRMLFLTTE